MKNFINYFVCALIIYGACMDDIKTDSIIPIWFSTATNLLMITVALWLLPFSEKE